MGKLELGDDDEPVTLVSFESLEPAFECLTSLPSSRAKGEWKTWG
jgi:hypothetical protein